MATKVPIKLRGAKGGITYVSACDVHRIKGRGIRQRGDYASIDSIGKLHVFIMGDRPAGVPSSYVIDHINWNKLDNTRDNLRWVAPRFNNWNMPVSPTAASPFKGVSGGGKIAPWKARGCGGHHLGYFQIEREAGMMAAKSFIQEFGELAATSAILLGDGPSNFSAQEIEEIKRDIEVNPIVPKIKKLPKGVSQNGNNFSAEYRNTYIGTYKSVDEAEEAYNRKVQDTYDLEWAEHQKLEVYKDSDGHAAIQLSGPNGKGKSTKVDEVIWHMLTFRVSWNLSGDYAAGCWKGKQTRLHTVVYTNYNPEYESGRESQVDHWEPESKLDNRIDNLRFATNSQQMWNQQKRANCTSQYIGIYFDEKRGDYCGEVRSGADRYRFYSKNENEVARWVNAKRLELFGNRAKLIDIIE